MMVTPYILVFALFVLYPVSYGFYLARDPQSYVKLWADPIFANAVFNSLLFLLVVVTLLTTISNFFYRADAPMEQSLQYTSHTI